VRLLDPNPYEGYERKDLADRPTIDPDALMIGMAKASQRQLDPIGEAIQNAEPAACIIQVAQGDGTWTGSGFLVDGNLIITAGHVLPKPENGPAMVQVSFDGETGIPVNVINGDSDVDVGLLHCPHDLPIKPMVISQEPVVEGDIVAVIGAPEGWPNVVTVGRVSGTEMTPPDPPDPSWQDMLFVDAHILEGSSGSMVIDVLGNAVGMAMGLIGRNVAEHGTGQNAVVPAHRIMGAIQSIMSQPRV
jgi:S1-C subfamily serine protease